jgi:hypothetical protein
MKFDKIINEIMSTPTDTNPNKVTITLELDAKMVKRIERLAEESLKGLLEREINQSGEAFIEMLGYDNY